VVVATLGLDGLDADRRDVVLSHVERLPDLHERVRLGLLHAHELRLVHREAEVRVRHARPVELRKILVLAGIGRVRHRQGVARAAVERLAEMEDLVALLDLEPVAVYDLLNSASKRMQLQAERAGLTLRVECVDDLPRVRIDSQRLEQVLVNLIHNAVKFTRPGGEVVLLAGSDYGFVRFAVRDSGVGIPADEVARIFERFYRVDKSRTGSGTGLGLSIAKHIVEAHAGKIWAESMEGEGSTFFFTIPSANV